MRENVESKFKKIFTDAEKIAESVGEKIEVPRIVHSQKHRQNYQSSSAEDYYRTSIFIPFLDHFISSISDRFVKHKQTLTIIENTIPEKLVRKDVENIDETVNVIMNQWPTATETAALTVINELLLWRQRWVGAETRPNTFIESLNLCNDALFKFLKIGATLAVTIASSERLKKWIRNSTGEDRLNGLAQMSSNRHIDIKVEEVIERFAQKQRRIDL